MTFVYLCFSGQSLLSLSIVALGKDADIPFMVWLAEEGDLLLALGSEVDIGRCSPRRANGCRQVKMIKLKPVGGNRFIGDMEIKVGPLYN